MQLLTNGFKGLIRKAVYRQRWRIDVYRRSERERERERETREPRKKRAGNSLRANITQFAFYSRSVTRFTLPPSLYRRITNLRNFKTNHRRTSFQSQPMRFIAYFFQSRGGPMYYLDQNI